MNDESNDLDEDSVPSGKPKWLIAVVIAVVCVIAGGIIWFVMQPADESETSEEVAEPLAPAIYLPIEPQFVVNYKVGERLRYAQIDVSLRVRSEAAKALIELHGPLVRSALVAMFGRLDFHGMRLPENRQLVADEALKVINSSLVDMITEVDREAGISDEPVEAVLFQTFVLQ